MRSRDSEGSPKGPQPRCASVIVTRGREAYDCPFRRAKTLARRSARRWKALFSETFI